MRLKSYVPCLALIAAAIDPAAADAKEAKAPVSSITPSDAQSSNAFTIAMYSQLRDQKGNLFFSGTSLRDALGIAYLGAKGDTASEMSYALRLDADPAKSAANAKIEIADWNLARGSADLTIANRLWSTSRFKMLPSFTQSALDGYGSPVAPVDFANDTEGSRKTINAWVEKQTHDKIKDLLPEGSVTPDTSLVITNAIYFKGKWATAFVKASTYDQAFLVDGTTSTDVPMMHQTSVLGFGHTAGVKVLEMSYDKSDLAMDVLLPDDAKSLPQLEAGLTPASLANYVASVSRQNVIVTFPKAKFTWGGSMSKPLASLGMGSAFGGHADFSGITGQRDVVISEVVHKAFVAIDEEGTEAAAATGVVMITSLTSVDHPPPPPEFKADHPFVFVIRDVKRGRILFMGRVTNPKA